MKFNQFGRREGDPAPLNAGLFEHAVCVCLYKCRISLFQSHFRGGEREAWKDKSLSSQGCFSLKAKQNPSRGANGPQRQVSVGVNVRVHERETEEEREGL